MWRAHPYLIQIIRELAARRIDFIVAGGVAALLHGVQRMTLDLDIALDRREDNLHAFLDTVAAMGLRPRAPVPPETLLDEAAVAEIVLDKHALVFSFIDPDKPHRQIDVFISPRYDYETMIRESEMMDLHGFRVAVLSKRALIREKRAMDPKRAQDIQDLEALLRL